MHGVMMLQGHRICNWRNRCVCVCVWIEAVEGCMMEGWAIEGLNKKRLDGDNGAKYKGWFRSWIEIIGIERRLGWIRSEWIYRVPWGECEERLRYVKRDLVHASYPGIKSVRRPLFSLGLPITVNLDLLVE